MLDAALLPRTAGAAGAEGAAVATTAAATSAAACGSAPGLGAERDGRGKTKAEQHTELSELAKSYNHVGLGFWNGCPLLIIEIIGREVCWSRWTSRSLPPGC